MKTVILFGSARNNGYTRKMIDSFVEHSLGEIIIFDAYRDFADISPCKDCRYCWKNPGCCIHDQMDLVYHEIMDADLIVIASPVYFFGVSGVLKTVMDRFQWLWASRIRKDQPISVAKKGICLLCGGAPKHDGQFDAVKMTCGGLFKELHADFLGSVEISATDHMNADLWKIYQNEIIKLADQCYHK